MISDIVKGLSYEEKMLLFHELTSEIREHEQKDFISRFERTKELVCSIMDITYKEKCRERSQVIAKVIIANSMLNEGVSFYRLAKIMNTDSSTIYNYKTIPQNWQIYPYIYRGELTIWEKYLNYETN